ncbi:MAG: glycosyltransferase family 4 protein [Christensenellales bacterium]
MNDNKYQTKEHSVTKSNKVLFVASVERHLTQFHVPYMRYLQSRGYEVHTAAFGENVIEDIQRHYDLSFSRSPLGLANIAAYRKLKRIIIENDYKLIHCHTPVASLLTRLAARKTRRRGTVVIYTAHGFHFFKGNSAIKNLLFSNIEKFVSKFTDCIITINSEDYTAVDRYGFKAGNRFLTHGVGIDGNRFKPVDHAVKLERRAALGLGADDYIVIYPAEYSKRKNQAVLLRAIALVKEKQGGIVLLLPGAGTEWPKLEKLAAKLGIRGNIKLTGRRSDVEILLSVSDLSAAPSRQEGLPTHVIEAMATGLPCVASRIRGQADLVEDGVNGFLYDVEKPGEMAEKIMLLRTNPQLALEMRENNLKKAQNYLVENTVREMADIYNKFL